MKAIRTRRRYDASPAQTLIVLGALILFQVGVFPVALGQERSVGIGTETPNQHAILDLESTDQGLLVPRISTQARQILGEAITSSGLSSTNGLLVFDNQEDDFFFWKDDGWVRLGTGGEFELTSAKDGTQITLTVGEESTTFDVADFDNDDQNELQDLVVQDNLLSLTNSTVALDLSQIIDVDDADPDPTNELQDLGSVLTQGSDAGASPITNLADPTAAQDAATKNYVDNISVDDADPDPTNELQGLGSVLTLGSDAGASPITNLGDPTAAQDAATKNYVDNISVDDADPDPTNEIQDLSSVLTQGTDAGTNRITNLGDPTAAQDAATRNYVDNISVDDADADPANEIELPDQTGQVGNFLSTDGTSASWQSVLGSNPASSAAFKGLATGVAQTIGAGTVIQFDEQYDLGGNFDDANDQFIVPSDGIYHFDALVTYIDVGNNDLVTIEIQVDGVAVVQAQFRSEAVGSTIPLTISIDEQLTNGQVVTLVGFGAGMMLPPIQIECSFPVGGCYEIEPPVHKDP